MRFSRMCTRVQGISAGICGAVRTGGAWRGLFLAACLMGAIFIGQPAFGETVGDKGGTRAEPRISEPEVISENESRLEHLYVCPVLATGFAGYQSVLKDLGAVQLDANRWKYTNTALDKTFIVHKVFDDLHGIKEALTTRNAVVIIHGHGNYGIGLAPVSYEECLQGYADNISRVNDPNLLKVSSPFFDVSIPGIRNHFTSKWDPKFMDGKSAVMPFVFDDPRGDPPYNYYLTYQIPGDSTHYRIDSPMNLPIERFPEFVGPAWYSSEGWTPNSSNPTHWQYFARAYPVCKKAGAWRASAANPGYFGTNYYTLPANKSKQTRNTVKWIFNAPVAGRYKVYARWPISSSNTTRATYEVFTATGRRVVHADQSTKGGQWRELGEFSFNAGQNHVKLTDESAKGNIIADAVRVVHVSDMAIDTVEANFYAASRSTTGSSLTVNFTNQSTGRLRSWAWDFDNDGIVDSQAKNPTHTYTGSGRYTVKLTVSGPAGEDTTTATDYISVGVAPPPVQAEFSKSVPKDQMESVPVRVSFIDRSSGNPVSWEWDFNNDGVVDSHSQNPFYTFRNPGLHTVQLTVTDPQGNRNSMTKKHYVRVVTLDTYIDNTSVPQYHFNRSTILFQKDFDLNRDDMKYRKLFLENCYSGRHYLESFAHGTVFYALGNTGGRAGPSWMKGYLAGKGDFELWQIIQTIEAKYDFYNFNKKPFEQ